LPRGQRIYIKPGTSKCDLRIGERRSNWNVFLDYRRHVIASRLELSCVSQILVGTFQLKPQPHPAFLEIQSAYLSALAHGIGVSGYEQRHANNSELHCLAHPRTVVHPPIRCAMSTMVLR